MAENKDYLTINVNGGGINIAEDVIASIASTAALEVKGVLDMASSLASDLASGILGKKNSSKGVKIVFDKDGGFEITIGIIAEYDSRIPDVAKAVQERVSEAVLNMTGHSATQININVVGVAQRKES